MHDDEFRPADISDKLGMIRDMGPALGGISRHTGATEFHFNSNGILIFLSQSFAIIAPLRPEFLLLGWEA